MRSTKGRAPGRTKVQSNTYVICYVLGLCCSWGQYWLTSEHSMRLKAEPYSLFHYWYKRCRMQSRCILPLSLFAYSQVRGTVTPAFAGYFARIVQRDSSPSAMAPFTNPTEDYDILHPAICTPKYPPLNYEVVCVLLLPLALKPFNIPRPGPRPCFPRASRIV